MAKPKQAGQVKRYSVQMTVETYASMTVVAAFEHVLNEQDENIKVRFTKISDMAVRPAE